MNNKEPFPKWAILLGEFCFGALALIPTSFIQFLPIEGALRMVAYFTTFIISFSIFNITAIKAWRGYEVPKP